MVSDEQRLFAEWEALPLGARRAFEQQWKGVAAGGLPCGSAIVGPDENVVAAGRNHAYDAPRDMDLYPLQYTRLAHAEMNALALIPTQVDPAGLTLWTTQHPCLMCAAACQFIGIGKVRYIADDPSDHTAPEDIAATRGNIPYEALGQPLWWTVSNVLFLYNSAVQRGSEAGNIAMNQGRYPELVHMTLQLAQEHRLGRAAQAGFALPQALAPYAAALHQAAQAMPR